MKFSAKDGLKTINNLEHYQDVAFNPLNPGMIIFLDPCLLVTLWKTREWIFMKFS